MKKSLIYCMIITFFIAVPSYQAATINEAETKYCDTVTFALINGLRPTVDQAIEEIYKDSPKGIPQWAGYDTEVLKIKQLYGVGGAYEITLKIRTYSGPHIDRGIDEVTVSVGGTNEVVGYKHVQDL